jgi:malate dehydrogenase (oxaloacetate-decarboxylating)
MIIESAFALADYTQTHYREQGRIFPPIAELREVSAVVAAQVLRVALRDGESNRLELAALDIDALVDFIRSRMWQPEYLPYVLAEDAL